MYICVVCVCACYGRLPFWALVTKQFVGFLSTVAHTCPPNSPINLLGLVRVKTFAGPNAHITVARYEVHTRPQAFIWIVTVVAIGWLGWLCGAFKVWWMCLVPCQLHFCVYFIRLARLDTFSTGREWASVCVCARVLGRVIFRSKRYLSITMILPTTFLQWRLPLCGCAKTEVRPTRCM